MLTCSVLLDCFIHRHHNIICQGFCMWPELADYLTLVSLPPTCSHLCWRQLLQVPVQPERGVFQRCVRPVPGDDWWENMTFDPSAKSLITQPVFFFPFPFFNLWGGRRTFVALLDGLCERASGVGRTNKEKHRLSKDEHAEAPTGMQTCLSDSCRLCPDRGTQMLTWLPNQTLEIRGKVIFLNGQRSAF